MTSLIGSGEDLVLAAQRGGSWVPVTPIALPLVPVPAGTGAHWSHRLGPAMPGRLSSNMPVVLSVLATRTEVRFGTSRLTKFRKVPRGADFAARLATVLREYRASAFFADRDDLEIAIEDTANYGELVELIDAVTQAGFTAWGLTDPSDLTTKPPP
jgi:hypothetical protein